MVGIKTREEFEAMTKEQLDAYGNEHFGIDLDSRRKKNDMIWSLLKAQQAMIDEREELGDDADTSGDQSDLGTNTDDADPVSEPDGDASITVTHYPGSHVPLRVNGRSFTLPVGRCVKVPAWVLPTLDTVAGLKYKQE